MRFFERSSREKILAGTQNLLGWILLGGGRVNDKARRFEASWLQPWAMGA